MHLTIFGKKRVYDIKLEKSKRSLYKIDISMIGHVRNFQSQANKCVISVIVTNDCIFYLDFFSFANLCPITTVMMCLYLQILLLFINIYLTQFPTTHRCSQRYTITQTHNRLTILYLIQGLSFEGFDNFSFAEMIDIFTTVRIYCLYNRLD